jgi:hypothetical protein
MLDQFINVISVKGTCTSGVGELSARKDMGLQYDAPNVTERLQNREHISTVL